MLSPSRLTLIVLFLFVSLRLIALDEATKTPVPDVALISADQLLRAGKFAEAEINYQTILQTDSKVVAAQVGLVRSMLGQQKIDESLEAVNKALTLTPDAAALLAVKGDVEFRRGEMAAAETSYLKAKASNPKEVRAYLGLAKLYAAYSLYRKAFDLLQTAHTLAPEDIEVQRIWMQTLPRKDRISGLEAYLAGPHPEDPDETKSIEDYLDFLKATVDKPVHACKLVSNVEQTEAKLDIMYGADGHHMSAIGLPVDLNGRHVHLQFDTGAGGLLVNHRVAEKAGLTRISTTHYGGIGDQGLQSGYTAVADEIHIGELEFRDCIVRVSDRSVIPGADGLIGADVFGAYLVDIDLPGMQLKLSPLPKRPEDAVAPKSLNSEGEEQANAGQDEDSVVEQNSKEAGSSMPEPKPSRHVPKDRYIAPEMVKWTKVFRFGHMMLVPTSVNDSPDMLFALDTGAFANTLSLRAARQLGKVDYDSRFHVRGVSGVANKVYFANASLRFGSLQEPSGSMVTLDVSSQSRNLGTEISGFLGFNMLRILNVKLDYRDGLVDFEYDPKRVPRFAR